MPNILKINHNAGFFSCATIRLIEIIKYFNQHKQLPDEVDSSEQWAFFKKDLSENVVSAFFAEQPVDIVHTKEMVVTNEPGEVSFGDYSKFHFEDIYPFVVRYFWPSLAVEEMAYMYGAKYNINFDNTCAVFYRGNDKQRECQVTPYSAFIEKAKEIVLNNPNVRFLVQPDETEFLEAFTVAFPNSCFWFEETPHMRKKDSAIFYELPTAKKTEHGQYFLAAVIAMSRCKNVILHSGNGAMWCVLYRNSFEGVFQFRNKHIY